jgi:hypothetical protein
MRWIAAIVLGFVLGCVLSSSGQQAAAPASPAEQFLRSAGMRDALEQQRQQSLASTREEIAQVLEQLTGSGLPPEVRAELQGMGNEMAENVTNAYTVDEALAVYARAWDRNYPGDQFRSAMSQLATPEGQRLTRTVNEAISEMSQFTQQRRQAAIQRETNRLVARMREILNERGAAQRQ